MEWARRCYVGIIVGEGGYLLNFAYTEVSSKEELPKSQISKASNAIHHHG